MENKSQSELYKDLRLVTENLCQPLAIEDYVIQTEEDISPPKWHLAHSSWFFETFILKPYYKNYQIYDASFHHLFNSYYQTLGNPFPRHQRGLLSRPTVEEIYSYRHYIDHHINNLLTTSSERQLEKLAYLLQLGFNHEQQHQELLLMDIKHIYSFNPNFPSYQSPSSLSPSLTLPLRFLECEGGLIQLGHGGQGFCFDNESPFHKHYIDPFKIASRLVTNEEYLEFIEAKAYQQPCWWLSDGWDQVLKNRWEAPLYWHKIENRWHVFSLEGLKALDPSEPVSHVSFYEADAYARWKGARLPSEEEWEHFVVSRGLTPYDSNFMETKLLRPMAAPLADSSLPQQFFGDLWEWTSSPYTAYPGYEPSRGALGEYNGKFMANQMVLRGGSCATARSHIRASYRNFFQPEKRWQFSGIRLAKN